ncbi:MAG: hypothetical protein PVI30_06735 [Myxococcales bacterium]|jgi:hypothetical protein
MKIDREKFFTALVAASLSGAVGCGSEPAPAEAAPEESVGAEEAMEPMEPVAEEEPEMAEEAQELPAVEEEPEVEETGPTTE